MAKEEKGQAETGSKNVDLVQKLTGLGTKVLGRLTTTPYELTTNNTERAT